MHYIKISVCYHILLRNSIDFDMIDCFSEYSGLIYFRTAPRFDVNFAATFSIIRTACYVSHSIHQCHFRVWLNRLRHGWLPSDFPSFIGYFNVSTFHLYCDSAMTITFIFLYNFRVWCDRLWHDGLLSQRHWILPTFIRRRHQPTDMRGRWYVKCRHYRQFADTFNWVLLRWRSTYVSIFDYFHTYN